MNKLILSCIAVAICTASALAQTPKFTITPKHPKEGDRITIVYDARETNLKDAEQVQANLTGYQDFKWVYDQLPFKKSDSVWTADYIVPQGMGLINLIFVADTLQDKGGDQTYSYILSQEDGRQVSGGMLGWGLLRTPHLVRGVPYVVDSSAYKTPEILMMWVKYELQNHPENRFKVLYAAASTLKHMNTEESLSKLNAELSALGQIPDLKEEDLVQLHKVYKEVLNDTTKANEIDQQIVANYPEGKYATDQARLRDFQKINDAKDDASRLKGAMDFVDQHSYNPADAAFNDAHRISHITAYWIISVYTSMNKDFENYKKYVSKAEPYMSLANVIYRSISVPFVSQNSMTAEEILPYTQVVLERLNYYKDNFQGDEYATLYYANAALFARILEENKLYDEAFVYAAAARSVKGYEDADLNDTYAQILHGQGKTKQLKEDLEASFRVNQSSTDMLDLMKALYLAENGSDKGYNDYLSSLKDNEIKDELKAKVRRMLMTKTVPNFELLDQFGKKISLAEQKGKIVILDFWASWCAPCKAAFPGMKLAVEHYKNDPNVVFYFVNTQEKKEMTDYVKNYMEENNYPFTALMDTGSQVAKSFGVSAIPHKIVVGPDGHIRFSEVGYMGSASELSDEIIEMVTLLKAGE